MNRSEPKNLSRKTRRDIRTLRIMTGIYCRDHHRAGEKPAGWFRRRRNDSLCPDCEAFLAYAIQQLCRCPLTPKPACRDCHIHCFAPAPRETVRQIMRYAWPRIIRRGRIDLLWKVLVIGWRKSGENS